MAKNNLNPQKLEGFVLQLDPPRPLGTPPEEGILLRYLLLRDVGWTHLQYPHRALTRVLA